MWGADQTENCLCTFFFKFHFKKYSFWNSANQNVTGLASFLGLIVWPSLLDGVGDLAPPLVLVCLRQVQGTRMLGGQTLTPSWGSIPQTGESGTWLWILRNSVFWGWLRLSFSLSDVFSLCQSLMRKNLIYDLFCSLRKDMCLYGRKVYLVCLIYKEDHVLVSKFYFKYTDSRPTVC